MFKIFLFFSYSIYNDCVNFLKSQYVQHLIINLKGTGTFPNPNQRSQRTICGKSEDYGGSENIQKGCGHSDGQH